MDLTLFSLVVDIALGAMILIAALRFTKSQGGESKITEVIRLEKVLRELMKQAESSSRTLDTELLKRKQSLMQTLTDIETIESRVNKALHRGDEMKMELERVVHSARILSEDIRDIPVGGGTRSQKVTAEPSLNSNREMERVARPPMKDSITPAKASDSNLTKSIVIDRINDEDVTWGHVNIYGEPLGEGPQIQEQEEVEDSIIEEITNEQMQEIYDAAENLIRAGKDMQTVSRMTRLPLEEVKLLHTIVEREKAPEIRRRTVQPEQEQSAAPQGGIRRQVQVL